MPTFQKTAQDEQNFSAFIEKINKTIDTLLPYADHTDLSQLEKVRDGFCNKIDDFYREDRKLNIGIIGRVNAGKSTFLNTLLFGGKNVLPSAATPKTATLTKIEFSEDNRLEVEYYSEDEWQILEKNALVDSTESEFKAAREIVTMCREKGLIPAELIAKRTDEFKFASADELMERLDDYVGENGRYTALVKNVTIHINKPDLEDISVVDTPGLNDPIVSRTDATRKFLGLCDVVFFLSTASQFLDADDMRLLTFQLPQDGVKKIVMICSRFDDGLTGPIDDFDSIEEAIDDTKKRLSSWARKVFGNPNIDSALRSITNACKEPIFVSSICYNMSNKDKSTFDRLESRAFESINKNGDVTAEVLKKIGNIEAVRAVYDDVVSEKDKTLSMKARDFIPNAEREYNKTVTELKERAVKKAEILKSGDRQEIVKQKNMIASQINNVKGSSEGVFGDVLARIEKSKVNTLRRLRDLSTEYARLNDKTGTESHTSSHEVSDSKWYKPWTWGKSHTEYSTYTTTYVYLEASDALENIRVFLNEACSNIERAFSDNVDIPGIKRQLLNVVVSNLDTSSEFYDPGLFRYVTEQTLNQIEFPVLKMDCSSEQAEISSKFSGEIRNSGERSALKALLSDTIGRLLTVVESKFLGEIASFRKKIETIKADYSGLLLKNIEEDFDTLMKQLENKENEIRNYENLIVLFSQIT